MTQERRKVVVIAASIAAMSGSVGLLARHHPWLAGVWLGLLFVALVYVMVQLVKIQRSKKQ